MQEIREEMLRLREEQEAEELWRFLKRKRAGPIIGWRPNRRAREAMEDQETIWE